MPDENREVLQTLLYFLRDVSSLVEENQMTPMNLAVCLGPSLFHLSILKNEMLSPRWSYELMNTDAYVEKKIQNPVLEFQDSRTGLIHVYDYLSEKELLRWQIAT